MKKEYADLYCDCILLDGLDLHDNVLDEDALYEEEDILFASQKPYDIRTYPYRLRKNTRFYYPVAPGRLLIRILRRRKEVEDDSDEQNE